MDDEEKPHLSLLHHKVASLEYNPTLRFKDWMNKGTTSQASRKVQSSLRLPTSSPSQTGGMLLMIKDEPWQGPTELSHDENLTSAARDWIGPSNKNQTHSPPNQVKLMVASLEYNPTLSFKKWMNKSTTSQASRKVQSSPTQTGQLMIKDEPWQGPPGLSQDEHVTSAAQDWIGQSSEFQTHSPPNQVKLMQLPNQKLGSNIPTRPRSSLNRKARGNEQSHKPATPSPYSTNKNGSKSADNLLCHLCHVSCSSALTMQQHLRGRSHRAKIMYMKMKRESSSSRSRRSPRCDICEIWCSDAAALQMHFKGQKHKSKIQELQLCKERGGKETSKAPIMCDVCRVPCMNQECFEMHLKGRQHATKQDLKRTRFH